MLTGLIWLRIESTGGYSNESLGASKVENLLTMWATVSFSRSGLPLAASWEGHSLCERLPCFHVSCLFPLLIFRVRKMFLVLLSPDGSALFLFLSVRIQGFMTKGQKKMRSSAEAPVKRPPRPISRADSGSSGADVCTSAPLETLHTWPAFWFVWPIPI